MKTEIIICIIFLISSCRQQGTETKLPNKNSPITNKALQDSIITEHLENGAWKHGLYSKEWQEEINKGLAKDSTIAYLWQQKSMPLFKQGKYELGMQYLDKAVKYDQKNEWQEYRAFMKCIFSKTYKEAILDFEDCKKRHGNRYVMDHSYDFYIALSKIQLNEFAIAEDLLESDINRQTQAKGEDWIHYLDWFYLAIAKYEQGKYEEAITVFDKVLKLYPQFSEVLYYKGNCLGRLGKLDEAKELTEEAQKYGKKGNTIKEDNSIYERYPYQIRWELWN